MSRAPIEDAILSCRNQADVETLKEKFIRSNPILTAKEKEKAEQRVQMLFDNKAQITSEDYVKFNTSLIALRDAILNDESCPLNRWRVRDTITEMALHSEPSGRIRLTKKQLAARMGMHINNMNLVLNYLKGLGAIFECEKGSVPADYRLWKAEDEEMADIYYGK